MELVREWITHHRDGQEISGYVVRPAMVKEPIPAVLVIQEIWGPDEHIQDLTERFAAAGYVALAPDLYSRGGRAEAMSQDRISELKGFMDTVPPGAWHDRAVLEKSLANEPKDKATRIQETLGMLFGPKDNDGMVADLSAWIDWLQNFSASREQPVGSTGYCMGGTLSFRLACSDARLKVAQVYYGTAPDEDQLKAVHCPVYGFYGATDQRITDAVPEVERQMQAHKKTYKATVYPGAGHAFFNDSRASYDVAAARDAWAHTLSHFNQHLR